VAQGFLGVASPPHANPVEPPLLSAYVQNNKLRRNFDEIFWSGGACLKEQSITFWWRSGAPSPILPQFFTTAMNYEWDTIA